MNILKSSILQNLTIVYILFISWYFYFRQHTSTPVLHALLVCLFILTLTQTAQFFYTEYISFKQIIFTLLGSSGMILLKQAKK